jgi:hypothetical protein
LAGRSTHLQGSLQPLNVMEQVVGGGTGARQAGAH